jgi:ubiquitin C-terminal hydrolase
MENIHPLGDVGPSANEPPHNRKSVIGLANMGNTCYMNAAIQALRHFPEISFMCTRGLLTAAFTEQGRPSAPIAAAYAELVQSLQSAGDAGGFVRPAGFFEALQTAVRDTPYAYFTQRTAQDAHEFIVWLLDQLFMATAEPRDLPYSVDVEGSKEWADAFRTSYSPLVELFFGQLRVSYTCQACRTVHKRYEVFNSLKVQPVAGLSWAECIEEEIMAEEMIEGYECDTCKNAGNLRANVLKASSVMRLPKLLILTVKRYTPFGSRINTPIVHENCDFRFDPIFAPESTHSSRSHWYRTIGVVDHHGFGLGGGHYVAQCLSPVYKDWTLYDDEGVLPLPKGPNFGVQTYMVFMRMVKE